MAQNSNSSSSGFGSLLVRGFVGILSITATAVVSSMVQRYLTPSTVPWTPADTSIASPTAVPNLAPSPVSSPDTPSPNFASGDRPIDPNQPIDSVIPAESQPAVEQNSMNQTPVNTQQAEIIPEAQAPAAQAQSMSGQPSPQPNDGSELRDSLDKALRDKWNKN
ncbi:MAG TPA: hypothetical protein V6C57_17685 [Coleofasciculaceae cyanobacterium]